MCCSGVSVSPRKPPRGPAGAHPSRRIPPQDIDVVPAQDFLDLRPRDGLQVRVEIALMGFVPTVAFPETGLRAAGMIPVLGLAVIETDAQALLLGLVHERPQQVLAVGRGVDDVPVGDFRIEQREPIVVFAGDDDVLHAGLPREAHPRLGVVLDGVELPREGAVLGDGDASAQHDPLADAADPFVLVRAGRHRVDTPVDEHAEPRLAPPFHAGVALLGGLVGIGIGRFGAGAGGCLRRRVVRGGRRQRQQRVDGDEDDSCGAMHDGFSGDHGVSGSRPTGRAACVTWASNFSHTAVSRATTCGFCPARLFCSPMSFDRS